MELSTLTFLRLVFRLRFLHSTIIIDEYEGALILRVVVTLRSFITGTQVAL
jgi:hypothetical protein